MEKLFVIPTMNEADLLINKSGFQSTTEADFFELPGSDWKILISGIGIVPTIYNLTRHFSSHRYEMVVHAGIAGSYFLPLQPGEVVQVTRDTFADVGIDHGGIFRWVFHEGLWAPDKEPFRAGWLEVQENRNLKIESVSGITVDLVTASPERKAKMIERFNPQIESMEGAAVFYVCKMEKIPVIQIRSISNFTGIRDRKSWKIEEAIESLTNTLVKFL